MNVGDTSFYLTILELYKVFEHGQNKTYARCICKCGKEVKCKLTVIKNGMQKSCGCWKAEQASKRTTKRNYKHGLADLKSNRLYRIWSAMKTRCYNANSKSYHIYGGRGISICKQWLESYVSFHDWSMSNGYNDNLSIDRIDTNGNYEPSNCRWATRKQQSENTRPVKRSGDRMITAFGIAKTIKEWLSDKRCVVGKATLCYRLGSGWPPEDAISKPSERAKTCL